MQKIILTGRLGNQLWQFAFAHYLSSQGSKVMLIYVQANIGKSDKADLELLRKLILRCGHDIYLRVVRNPTSYLSRGNVPGSKLFKLQEIAGMARDFRDALPADLASISFTKYKKNIGYFQSMTLLRGEVVKVRDELIDLITKPEESAEFKKLEAKHVFHLRYGDYLKVENRELFGVLSSEYYKRLLDLLELNKKEVLWLTDDPDGVRKYSNFFNDCRILGPSKIGTENAIYLMIKARNLAISNSSLAWWSALCNIKLGGSIFLPHPWTYKEKRDGVTSDNFIERGKLMPAIFLEAETY